jgi:hypothetical protein
LLRADAVASATRLGALALWLCAGCELAHESASGHSHIVASEPEARGERPVHRVPPLRPPGPRTVPEPPPALPPTLRRPAVPRVVAIGDLHGDLSASRRALELAGAIDDDDHWVGGELTIVQTGDVLDRGDEDRELSDLLLRLKDEAREAGGELITLSGNHELMNTMLTFDYVLPGGFSSFGGRPQRTAAFRPGGDYARRLSAQPILMQVGDSVFVHGGILPEHISYGLARMNDEVQAFMRGELASVPAALLDADGLLWTRLYSIVPGPADCMELAVALAELRVKRMVVGHTPQLGGISADCDGRVLRIDTGMSRFYLNGPVQVLEIQGDVVQVLKENAPPSSPLSPP